MRIVHFIILLLTTQISLAQLKVTKLEKNSLPKSIQYTGHIINAVRWADSSGNHIVITTETGETPSKTIKEEDYKDAALYAYHYLVQPDSLMLLWKVYDYSKECPLDINANYIKNTFTVTDLNKNGKAEVWLMYKTACRGDVSPASMKIVMYEGPKKHVVRGTTKVTGSEEKNSGGEYTMDEAFKNAPLSFKQFAMQLWKRNLKETWD